MSVNPSDLTPTEKIESTKPIGQDRHLPVPTEDFQALMQQPAGAKAESAHMASPFDLAGTHSPLAQGPSYDALIAQTNSSEATYNDLRNQLNTPNLKLKQSQKHLLSNKLSDANVHLRSAAEKIGAPLVEETKVAPGSGPIAKFLNFVNNGVAQIQSAKQEMQSLKDKGQAVSPADYLLIQMKMNKAQQELEYSSVILSKAVSAVHTLMSIQL